MEILSFEILPSTQQYLIREIRAKRVQTPCAVLTLEQNAGVGSRNNAWMGGKGNFFASIALPINGLPDDLPLHSASIYFSFLMKKVLSELHQNIWLKWPNDLYLDDEKIGGCITQKIENCLVCGIGVNLKNRKNGYKALGLDIQPEILLKRYLEVVQELPKWKHIFREYEIEFELSRAFSVHIENCHKSLSDAVLCSDGSIIIEGKKVYSLR